MENKTENKDTGRKREGRRDYAGHALVDLHREIV